MAVESFSMESWDPIKADLTNAPSMLTEIYDWMFRMEAGKLVPGVVETWETAPDGLSWVFHVRKGIKFSNGDDVTARDVKFSIERYMSKDAWGSNVRTAVDHVDLVDNYTLRVFTKGTQPYLPTYMAALSQAQGLVMPMDYINKNGVDYFIKNPMGSGPWQVTKYVPGDSVQYTAKDSNWRQVPAFKTLTVMVVPDPATRVAMLKAGDVDVINVSLDDAAALEKAGLTTYQMMSPQARIQFHGTLDPRSKGSPMADVRVRQALAIAIDHEGISKTLFYGKALPPMPAQVLYGQPDIDSDYWVKYCKDFYKYDPAKAKKLLADAGYSGGFSLKLFVTVQAGMEYVPKLAEIVQQSWKAIGVNAELLPLDKSTFQTYRREPADILVGQATFGTTNTLAPAISMLEVLYGSKGVNPLTTRNTSQGAISFTPDLDKLVYSAMSEIDPVKRRTLIAQVIKQDMDTYTSFAFGQVPVMMAVSPKVKFDIKQPLEVPYTPHFADIAQHR